MVYLPHAIAMKNDAIAKKITSKLCIEFLRVSSAQIIQHLLEIALPLKRKYSFSSSVTSYQTIFRKYFVNARDFAVAMVTT